MFTFSFSGLKDYTQCPRLYRYKHLERLVPRRVDPKLYLGRLVHAGVEAYYNQRAGRGDVDPLSAVDALAEEEFNRWTADGFEWEEAEPLAKVEMAKELVRGYVDWAATADLQYLDEVVWAEADLTVPVVNPDSLQPMRGVRQHLRIDGVWRDHHGRLWVVEHKTTAQGFPEDEVLRLDAQGGSYLLAVETMFPEAHVMGVLYNHIRVPREGGTVGGMRSERLRRTRIIWNPTMRTNLRRRLYYIVGLMKRERVFAPHPGLHCGWCQYRSLCVAEEDGSDVQALKEALFVQERREVRTPCLAAQEARRR